MIKDIHGIVAKPGDRICINKMYNCYMFYFDIFLDENTKILMIKRVSAEFDKPYITYLSEYKNSFEIIN